MSRPQTVASMNQTKKVSHTENRALSITKWFCRKNKERKRKDGVRQESQSQETHFSPHLKKLCGQEKTMNGMAGDGD